MPNKLGKDAWAWSCGNWTPDPARYPNGMLAAADAVHANGLKYILWFEPERAMVGTETHQRSTTRSATSWACTSISTRSGASTRT